MLMVRQLFPFNKFLESGRKLMSQIPFLRILRALQLEVCLPYPLISLKLTVSQEKDAMVLLWSTKYTIPKITLLLGKAFQGICEELFLPSLGGGKGKVAIKQACVTLLESKDPSCHLGRQWSHTHFTTLHCSKESSRFIKQSLSYRQDFNHRDTIFSLTYPTIAFLERKSLGRSKNPSPAKELKS